MPDQPTGESQDQPSKESDADVKTLAQQVVDQQKQITDLTTTLSNRDRDYREAERRMHDATQQAAKLKETQKPLSREEVARLLDDPEKLDQHINSTAESIADAKVKSAEEAFKADLDKAMGDVAGYLAKREAEDAVRFKQVDPRYESKSFKDLKEKYGELIPDETLLKMSEKDGNPPPSAPTGSSGFPVPTQEDRDIRSHPMYDAIFKQTVDKLGAKE